MCYWFLKEYSRKIQRISIFIKNCSDVQIIVPPLKKNSGFYRVNAREMTTRCYFVALPEALNHIVYGYGTLQFWIDLHDPEDLFL
jgi:hypothetical protein